MINTETAFAEYQRTLELIEGAKIALAKAQADARVAWDAYVEADREAAAAGR